MLLFRQCHHTHPPLTKVIVYCLTLSSVFVLGLYALVPRNVRALSRNHPTQIQWRAFAVCSVSILSTLAYPFVFCSGDGDEFGGRGDAIKTLRFMGWTPILQKESLRAIVAVPMHAAVLYLGCFFALALRIHVFASGYSIGSYSVGAGTDRRDNSTRDTGIGHLRALYELHVRPSPRPVSSSERWGAIRDYVVAPFAEEVVFRGCMVCPLLSAGLRPPMATAVAPLFFGTAHVHHAYVKLRDGGSVANVVISTIVQFAYTTLFGMYAAHAFLRTGSTPAVIFCHSFCNVMGLPDLSFMVPPSQGGGRLSCLFGYRHIILAAYIVGMVLFGIGFTSSNVFGGVSGESFRFFPKQSVLPELIRTLSA